MVTSEMVYNYGMMKKLPYVLLRIGIAITFIGVGIFILQDPRGWGLMVQPWALKLIPGSLVQVMISTAIVDIIIGILLLFNIWTWLAALVGAIHLLIVLITTGVTVITVRDIGLLFATTALCFATLPDWITRIL